MRRLGIAVVLLALCAASVSITLETSTASNKKAAAKSIPLIARVLGVQVGKDTIESLERILGPGAPTLGGHPHGARVWYLKRQRLYVYADGFDYAQKGGLIINKLRISSSKDCMGLGFPYEEPKPVLPRVGISSRRIGWLGSILPGMTTAAVKNLTSSLPKSEKKGDTVRWRMSGIYKTAFDEQRDTWVAELTFKKNVLTTVEVYLGS